MLEYVVVTPTSLSLRLFIASCVIGFLVIVATALRLFSRYFIAVRPGWDDGLALIATVGALTQTVLFSLLVYGGLGHHADTVPEPNQFSIPKILFSFEIFHVISLNTGKLSALSFYLKLFANKTMERATKAASAFIAAWMIGLLLWEFLFCRPLWKMFEWGGLEQCGDRKPLYIAVCTFSIFSDLLLLALPMPVIWTLKMDRDTKLRLSCLFAAGFSVTAVSITRLVYIVTIDYHHDFSFYSVSATFLANLEPLLTILCISLPMIYSLYAKVVPKGGRRSSHGSKPVTWTFASSLVRRGNPKKRAFNPLETSGPEHFELDQIYSPEKRVRYNVSVDRGWKTDPHYQSPISILQSSKPEGDASSGSEAGLVHYGKESNSVEQDDDDDNHNAQLRHIHQASQVSAKCGMRLSSCFFALSVSLSNDITGVERPGASEDLTIHKDISFLHRYHQKYDTSFELNTLLGAPTIFTIAPENIKLIHTREHEWGIQPNRLPGMEYFCGRGFLTMDGEIWRQSRRALRPSFAKSNLANLSVLSRETDTFLDHLPKDGATVDLPASSFLNTSLHFLLGVSPGAQDLHAPCTTQEFINAFHGSLFLTMLRIILGRAWHLLPQGKYRRVCGIAHSFLNYYVNMAMNRRLASNNESNSKQSLIDNLAALSDDTVFIRIRSEVLQQGDNILKFDAFQGNTILENILFEALRLYPIFPLMGRVALCDTTLPTGSGPNHDAPVFIPKGTDPHVFGEDVEAFRPERRDNIQPGQWDFMGFGGGNRACLGRQKSLVEASYLLARTAMRFEKLESRDDRDWRGEMKLTCQNGNGCKVAFA
ncbi:Uu.00g108820.m01.CDS01 [Anthostomella pinea]|uniref:Uu.00g108820.m01.CDS01 n=1 Tax=Anthostomella pinea TaxID=933095 RepID=A0AAI8VFK0_9PEZI|nr:Uu.00g108820.m01.CDS01 [Anthostomella pinea]